MISYRIGTIGRLCLLTLLALEGCAPGRSLPLLPPSSITSYHLDSGDQVRIITYGQDQLTGDFSVGDSGRIDVPLLGRVPAAGLTAAGLEDELTRFLQARKLLRNPSVSVEITQYRPIFILGEVSHPGQFTYQPGMTVLSAVANAGGFTYRAVEGYASVVRTEGRDHGHAIEGRVGRDAFLEPGDVVTIFERYF